MNRLVPATMFSLALAASGCARGRAALPPDPMRTSDLGPIEIKPIEPIKTSINAGKIPADLNTVRASYEPDAPAATDKAKAPAPMPAKDLTDPPGPEKGTAEPNAPAPGSRDVLRPVSAAKPAEPEAVPQVAEPLPMTTVAEPASRPAEAVPPAPFDAPQSPDDASKEADRPKTTGAATGAKDGDPAMTIRAEPDIAPGKAATQTVAVVGDTIITGRMLYTAMCQKMGMKPGEIKMIPPDKRGEAAKMTLDSLIESTMILQEGRRGVKKTQMWNTFTDFIDKDWREKELATLLRRENAEDEFVLRRKLEERGESLDDIKDAWKLQHMSTQLLMMKVQPKVKKPSLLDLEEYYAEHRNDPSFHRDAKVYWREILVPIAAPKDRSAARKTAAALREKLVAGEDFAKLAKANSAGATAASNGGAWITAQDGHAVPAINDALGKLAPGQLSGPIESPQGIHIIRVEKRTAAGPKPFVEVQREIAATLFEARFQNEITVYLKDLRKRTAISSPMFDVGNGPPSAKQRFKLDPETIPASAQ